MTITYANRLVARHITNTIVPSNCDLIPLVDGPEIYAAMETALLAAKEFIFLTAWLLHPNTVLKLQALVNILKAKAAAGVDVRILLCDLDLAMGHFPAKMSKVAAANWEQTQAAELRKYKIKVHVAKLDIVGVGMSQLESMASTVAGYPVVIASHHQKTLMMDGKYGPVSFCSGCDIVGHVKDASKWHDASIMIKGSCGNGVIENFVERWNVEAKVSPGFTPLLPPSSTCTHINCKVVRTMPGTRTEVRAAYLDAIRSAKKSIYIENQYLRDPEIGSELVNAATRGIDTHIVLPTEPEEAAILDAKTPPIQKIPAKLQIYSQYRILKALLAQDASATKQHLLVLRALKDKSSSNLKISRPHQKGRPYVHAKVMIVDEQITLIGSANANGRSMSGKCDSEIDVRVDDKVFAATLRKKLDASVGTKLTTFTSAMVANDEKITRISLADMRSVQRLILGMVHSSAAAAGAAAVAVAGGGAIGFIPDSWVKEASKQAADVAEGAELAALELTVPGIRGALTTPDPDDFRDRLTDAAIDLL